LVAGLASWLDARAHNGQWLVRIEDIDTPRCVSGADEIILEQLAACGLVPDEAPLWQSERTAWYDQALASLVAADLAYPCGCSRSAIDAANAARGIARPRNGERVYPGTCRNGLQGTSPAAWRMRTQNAPPLLRWQDRRLGEQTQNLHTQVGDFVLRRADGLYTYQLAVVVDDAAQGISHVVRGEDLADNTARFADRSAELQLLVATLCHLVGFAAKMDAVAVVTEYAADLAALHIAVDTGLPGINLR
jgi:glutamyl-Q tRNA(Asp) synthetase